jgi:hypothetical protein
VGDRSRGRFATPADFPPHDVARTEGYTYAAKVWAMCLVQGPFSVAPCQTLIDRFATFSPLYDQYRADGENAIPGLPYHHAWPEGDS